jgi:hypothetical protein
MARSCLQHSSPCRVRKPVLHAGQCVLHSVELYMYSWCSVALHELHPLGPGLFSHLIRVVGTTCVGCIC